MKALPKKMRPGKVELAAEPLSGKPAHEDQKNLRGFLEQLKARLPYDCHRVEKEIAPARFEVTALLQHLENEKRFPVLFFEKPLDMEGLRLYLEQQAYGGTHASARA